MNDPRSKRLKRNIELTSGGWARVTQRGEPAFDLTRLSYACHVTPGCDKIVDWELYRVRV